MLTQELLRDLFTYIPETGHFIWNSDRGCNRVKGKIAGTPDKDGYILLSVNRKLEKAHRMAFLYMLGHLPKQQVDHINGIKYDNRWENLREASNRQNMQNSKGKVYSEIGIKGIQERRIKGGISYSCRIRIEGAVLCKSFRDLEIAKQWLSNTRKQYHGEFAHD